MPKVVLPAFSIIPVSVSTHYCLVVVVYWYAIQAVFPLFVFLIVTIAAFVKSIQRSSVNIRALNTSRTHPGNHRVKKEWLTRLELCADRPINTAKIQLIAVPVVMNTRPNIKICTVALLLLESTNCGNSARKKIASFGFSTSIIAPCSSVFSGFCFVVCVFLLICSEVCLIRVLSPR